METAKLTQIDDTVKEEIPSFAEEIVSAMTLNELVALQNKTQAEIAELEAQLGDITTDPEEKRDDISSMISSLYGMSQTVTSAIAKRTKNINSITGNSNLLNASDKLQIEVATQHHVNATTTPEAPAIPSLCEEAQAMLDSTEENMRQQLSDNKILYHLADQMARYEGVSLQGSLLEDLLLAQSLASLSDIQRESLFSLTNGDISASRLSQIIAHYAQEQLISVEGMNDACARVSQGDKTAHTILAVGSMAIALEVGREIIEHHIENKRAYMREYGGIEHNGQPPMPTITKQGMQHQGALREPPVVELLPMNAHN